MPSLITHDTFGQDIYASHYKDIGTSHKEYEAFLLGNQGPDPLFFSVLDPRLSAYTRLGSTMHKEEPTKLLLAFKQSLDILRPEERSLGRAYVFGFVCHYILDSHMHPLVYSHEYTICEAGVEGLDSQDKHEVHALIESELDEMVLFKKYETTVANFDPSRQILRSQESALDTISKMYQYAAMLTYGAAVPDRLFKSSTKSYRRAARLFHSPSGVKRSVLGVVETGFRRHSFIRAMSPRPMELNESVFENRAHKVWQNPFTGLYDSRSFWNIYEDSLSLSSEALSEIDRDSFGLEKAREITKDLDFSGRSTVAVLTVEES